MELSSTGRMLYFTVILLISFTLFSHTDAQPYISTGGRAVEGGDFTVKCVELTSGDAVEMKWTRVDKAGNPIGGEQTGTYSSRVISGIWESSSSLTIPITRTDDQSQLTCTTTSKTGRVQTSRIRIYVDVVPLAPTITGDGNLAEGQNATFVCTVAEAKPSAYINWRWSTGTLIQDDTSTTTQNADGTYRTESEVSFIARQSFDQRDLICEVQHSKLVTKLTADVRINVVYKPSVSVSKIYYETQVGARLVMDCTVTSNPPASSVGWLKNESIVTIGSGYTIGPNDRPSLTISNVVEEDAGYYVCSATNSAGTLRSDTVRVEVRYVPQITLPGPKSISLNEGERVTLQCEVDSNPAANVVVWRKGSTSLIPLNTTLYEGSTPQNPSLVIKSVSRSDSAIYQCTAENNYGIGTSTDSINLVIKYAPTISTVSPPTQTVTEGTPVTYQCTSDGEPSPQYQWYKGDTAIANSAFLNIPSAGPDDNGIYTCVSSNDKGTKNQTAELVVRYTPIVTIPLDSYGADEGQTVTIPCSFKAVPDTVNIQWLKDSAALSITGGKYSGGVASNPDLTITSLTRSDAGNYRCRVSNSIGTGEDSARVDISFAPVSGVINNPTPSPEEGDVVTLTCAAAGAPEPSYSWFKDNVKVHEGKTYTIPKVSITDSGAYTCFASNDKGNTTSTANLDVRYAPKLKFTGDVTVVGGDSVVVVPLEINANPAPTSITWYKNGVEFTLTPATKYGGGTLDNPALIISDVSPTDNGVYQAQVTNDIGSSRSPIIELKGLFPPTNTRVNPETQTIKENEPFNINCTTNGSPTPDIYWTRGTETRRDFEGTSRFARSGATFEDDNYFTCWVSNSAGNNSARAYVVVLYKPKGRTDNRNFAYVGDTVTLTCPVISNPVPTSYRWWFEKTPLLETSVNLTVTVNSTLFGNYICRATNNQGESGDIYISIEDNGKVGESTDEGLSLTYIVLIVLIIIILLCLIIIAIIFCCKQGLCAAICGKKRSNSTARVSPEPEVGVKEPIKSPNGISHLPYNGYTSSTSTVSRQDVEFSMNGSASGRPKTAQPTTGRIRIEEGSQYNRYTSDGKGPIISIMEPELKSARAHQLPPLPGHDQIEETPVKKMKRKKRRRHKATIREEDDAALTDNQQNGTPISD